MHLCLAQGSSIFPGLDADVLHMWMFFTPLPSCLLLLIFYENKQKNPPPISAHRTASVGYSSETQ